MLLREAGHAVRVGGEPFGKDLGRYVAIELAVGGAVDSTHHVFAELGSDAVVAIDCCGLICERFYGMVSLSTGWRAIWSNS